MPLVKSMYFRPDRLYRGWPPPVVNVHREAPIGVHDVGVVQRLQFLKSHGIHSPSFFIFFSRAPSQTSGPSQGPEPIVIHFLTGSAGQKILLIESAWQSQARVGDAIPQISEPSEAGSEISYLTPTASSQFPYGTASLSGWSGGSARPGCGPGGRHVPGRPRKDWILGIMPPPMMPLDSRAGTSSRRIWWISVLSSLGSRRTPRTSVRRMSFSAPQGDGQLRRRRCRR